MEICTKSELRIRRMSLDPCELSEMAFFYAGVVCTLICIVYCINHKRTKYKRVIYCILNDFDYFISALCIEQSNNKYLVLHNVTEELEMKCKALSVLSAKSYVECTCVSVHMAMTSKSYTRKDRRYILGILKNDQELLFLFYENYMTTLSKLTIRRELPMYRHIDVIEGLDLESFRSVMDSLR